MKFVLKILHEVYLKGKKENIEDVYISDDFDEIHNILKNIDYIAYELFYVPNYVKLW